MQRSGGTEQQSQRGVLMTNIADGDPSISSFLVRVTVFTLSMKNTYQTNSCIEMA